ncbi:MAG: response regulator [Gammaproteobacteria bacterium]
MTTRIALVDDQVLFLEGLRHLLDAEPDIAITYTASDPEKARSELPHQRLDLLLIDFMMPEQNGGAIIRDLRDSQPDLPILGISAYPTNGHRDAMLAAGANGFVAKNSGFRALLDAIHHLTEGGHYVEQTLPRCLTRTELSQTKLDRLSQRETEVARLLARGLRDGMIAKALRISEKSVATYRTRIVGKLNLRNGTELVRLGLHVGWA